MKAFPNGVITNKDGVIVGGQRGMDLIDYFAAQAMQGLLATIPYENNTSVSYTEIAEQSYIIAAAMMEARGA
jgi:hypothetical protein